MRAKQFDYVTQYSYNKIKMMLRFQAPSTECALFDFHLKFKT